MERDGLEWNGMGTLIFGGSGSVGTERNWDWDWDQTDTDIRGSDSWDRFLLFLPFIFSLAVKWEWIRPDFGFGFSFGFRKEERRITARWGGSRNGSRFACLELYLWGAEPSGGRAELSWEVAYRRLVGCVGFVFGFYIRLWLVVEDEDISEIRQEKYSHPFECVD